MSTVNGVDITVLSKAVDFAVLDWNAWAPGVSSREDWLGGKAFVRAEKAALPATVPKTLQRRLSH